MFRNFDFIASPVHDVVAHASLANKSAALRSTQRWDITET